MEYFLPWLRKLKKKSVIILQQNWRKKAGGKKSTIAAKGEQVIKTDEKVRRYRKSWHKEEVRKSEGEN